jgi:DNA repair photolyase
MPERKHKGRGVHSNSPNRFEKLGIDPSSYAEYCSEFDDELPDAGTEYFKDFSRSVLIKNDSPDLGAGYSINPYRGCEHGCVYCYARPTHEYLGFSAGLDFESKIMVKHDAPELLESEFRKRSWTPQPVFFSGNTDCYQPAERVLGITRKCIEVFLKFRNPLVIITKSSLVRRDADLLRQLTELNLVSVIVTLTTLKESTRKVLEPRASTPARRLDTIEFLTSQGVNTGVNVAPIIPGLTDEEIPSIIREASQRGAKFAGRVMLRLPHSVKEMFSEFLRREFPDRAEKILNRVREIHGGRLYDHTYGKRLTGEGIWADTIRSVFDTSCKKYGLNEERFDLDCRKFTREDDQYSIF